MNKSNCHNEKAKVWKARIIRASEFSGSIREFCQSEGVTVATFQYWRQKLGQEKQTPTCLPRPFVRVQVTEPIFQTHRHSELPDPKWVAEVILYLQKGIR